MINVDSIEASIKELDYCTFGTAQTLIDEVRRCHKLLYATICDVPKEVYLEFQYTKAGTLCNSGGWHLAEKASVSLVSRCLSRPDYDGRFIIVKAMITEHILDTKDLADLGGGI